MSELHDAALLVWQNYFAGAATRMPSGMVMPVRVSEALCDPVLRVQFLSALEVRFSPEMLRMDNPADARRMWEFAALKAISKLEVS